MTTSCVLPHRHDPDRLRHPVDGLYVCHGCLGRLEQTLAEMAADYDALALKLVPAQGWGPHITGTREKALPIDPTVADHRADIRGKLSSWARAISEDRDLTPPPTDVNRMAGWLLVHLRWACAQPFIDEYATELLDLRRRTMSLIQPSGRRRVEVGACVEAGCDGVLTATVSPVDDYLPSHISCSHDGAHSWSSGEWHTLGRKIHGATGYGTRIAEVFRSA